jgi:alpha-D-xyloside xylohydrolase
MTSRKVFLPSGSVWKDLWSEKVYCGGQTVLVSAPLDRIPVFTRDDFSLNVPAGM